MTHLQKQWLQERGLEAPVEDAPDPLLARLEEMAQGLLAKNYLARWEYRDVEALRRVIAMLKEDKA